MDFDLKEIRARGQALELDFTLDEEALEALPKRTRDRAYAKLRELEEIKRASPLHFYNPFKNPKQHIFHSFPGDRAFLGGNQSGKTTAGIVDCLIQAQDLDSLPNHLKAYKKFRPPFRCRIGGQGRTEIEDFIFEKLKDWVAPSQLPGGAWKSGYDANNYILHFKNGSYFQFKTYDQDDNKWGGSTLDRVYLDEEPPPGKLKESRLRVMRRTGDILFAMTPVEGITHMFDEFEDYIERADENSGWSEDEHMGLVLVDMDENPWLSEESKVKALRGFSEEERAARKSGRFMALHGLIYSDFSESEHMIPEPEPDEAGRQIPENVNVIVGIDPGWAQDAGCAVVWAYVTPDDQMVVFEEFLQPSSTIKNICERIHAVNTHYGVTPVYYVIDPVARNRQSQTGRSDQMVFADHGVVAIAGQNAVDHGLVMVRERLQAGALKIWDTCTGLKREFRTYRWKNPPRTGEDGTPRPFKKHDHRLDALRYLVASRPYLPDVPYDDPLTPSERRLRDHQDQFAKPKIPVA